MMWFVMLYQRIELSINMFTDHLGADYINTLRSLKVYLYRKVCIRENKEYCACVLMSVFLKGVAKSDFTYP